MNEVTFRGSPPINVILYIPELNWIRLEIFLGLNIVFLFPNQIQFYSENFIEIFKIFFQTFTAISGWVGYIWDGNLCEG